MASIVQSPAPLNLQGVANSPFILTLNITLKDANGDTISWGDADEFLSFVQGLPTWSPNQLVEIDSLEPTLANPSDGVITLSWTGAQTQAFTQVLSASWAFLMVFEEEGGPFSLVAGSIMMASPTTPGSSTGTTEDLTVQIGTNTITIGVTLGGAGGGGGGGNDLPIADLGGGVTTDSTTYDNTFVGSGKMDVAVAADASHPFFAMAQEGDDFPRVAMLPEEWVFGDGTFDLNEKNASLSGFTNEDEAVGIYFEGTNSYVAAGNSDPNAGPNGATALISGALGIQNNDTYNFIAFCGSNPNTLEGGDSVGGNVGDVLIETDQGFAVWTCSTEGPQGTAVWVRVLWADQYGDVIAGDSGNVVTGGNGFAGGYENTITGIMGAAFGTKNQVLDSLFSFASGYGNTISGDAAAAAAFGDNNTVYGETSFATGQSALTYQVGQKSHASDNISAIGDAQDSLLTACYQTTDATESAISLVEFTVDSTAVFNRTVGFTITVVARRTDTPGTDSMWECKGVVRGDGSDTYSFIGSPIFNVIAQDTPASDWTVALNQGGSSLNLVVIGEDDVTINWNASVRLNEVAG